MDLYALNAELSRNPARLVAVVAAVLGFETAEVGVTPSLVTRGLRVSGPAKHGRSRRQATINGYPVLNS